MAALAAIKCAVRIRLIVALLMAFSDVCISPLWLSVSGVPSFTFLLLCTPLLATINLMALSWLVGGEQAKAERPVPRNAIYVAGLGLSRCEKRRYEKVKAKCASFHTQLQDRDAELKQLKLSYDAEASANSKLKIGMAERDDRISELTNDNHSLTDRLAAADDIIATLTSTNKSQDSELKALRKKNSKLNSSHTSMSKDLSTAHSTIKARDGTIAGLRGELSTVKGKFLQAVNSYKALLPQLAAFRSQAQQLTRDNATLTTSLHAAKEENRGLRAQQAVTLADNKDAYSLVEVLLEENSGLIDTVGELQGRLSTADDRDAVAEKKLAAADDVIQGLREELAAALSPAAAAGAADTPSIMGAQLAESLLQDKLVEADITAFEAQQELEATRQLLKEAQAKPLVQLNIKVESPVAPVQHLAAPEVQATPLVQLVVQVQEAPKAQEAAAAGGCVVQPSTVNAACQASLEVEATPLVQLVVQVQEAPKAQEAAAGGAAGVLKPSTVNAACQSCPESCGADVSLQRPQEEDGSVVKKLPVDPAACRTDQQAKETGEVLKEEVLSVCPGAVTLTPLLLTPEAPEVPQLETQPLMRTISSLSSGSGCSRSSSNGGAGKSSSLGGGGLLSSEGSALVLGSDDDEQGNRTAWGAEVSKDSHSTHHTHAVSSEDACEEDNSEAYSELTHAIKQALKSKAERTRTWEIQTNFNKRKTETATEADAAQFRVLAKRVSAAVAKCVEALPDSLEVKVQEVLGFAAKLEELSRAAAVGSSKTGSWSSHSSTSQAVSSRGAGAVKKAAAMFGGSVSSSSRGVLGGTGSMSASRVVAKVNSWPSKAKDSVPAAVESPSPVQTPAVQQPQHSWALPP